jgi:hypothetical protein
MGGQRLVRPRCAAERRPNHNRRPRLFRDPLDCFQARISTYPWKGASSLNHPTVYDRAPGDASGVVVQANQCSLSVKGQGVVAICIILLHLDRFVVRLPRKQGTRRCIHDPIAEAGQLICKTTLGVSTR